METQPHKQFCKKIAFGDHSDPTVILGIIESEAEGFLNFRTARKRYTINKTTIISIEDTNEIFREAGD